MDEINELEFKDTISEDDRECGIEKDYENNDKVDIEGKNFENEKDNEVEEFKEDDKNDNDLEEDFDEILENDDILSEAKDIENKEIEEEFEDFDEEKLAEDESIDELDESLEAEEIDETEGNDFNLEEIEGDTNFEEKLEEDFDEKELVEDESIDESIDELDENLEVEEIEQSSGDEKNEVEILFKDMEHVAKDLGASNETVELISNLRVMLNSVDPIKVTGAISRSSDIMSESLSNKITNKASKWAAIDINEGSTKLKEIKHNLGNGILKFDQTQISTLEKMDSTRIKFEKFNNIYSETDMGTKIKKIFELSKQKSTTINDWCMNSNIGKKADKMITKTAEVTKDIESVRSAITNLKRPLRIVSSGRTILNKFNKYYPRARQWWNNRKNNRNKP